jgi:hypothetical protein
MGWKFVIHSDLAISELCVVAGIKQHTSGNRRTPKDHPIAHLLVWP